MHGRTVFLTLLFLALGATNAFAATVSSDRKVEGQPLSFTATAESTEIGLEVAVVEGTATDPEDYEAPAPRAVPPGGSVSIQVPTRVDTADESEEQFFVVVRVALGGQERARGTGTIADPTLSVQDVAVSEANGFADVVISTDAGNREASVGYATSDGSASGQDYTGAGGRVTIPANANQATFRVPLTNDSDDEVDETVNVTLSGPAGGRIGDGTGTVTIVNDDLRAINVGDVTASEGDGPNVEIKLPVTLSAPTFRPVTVQFATIDAFARAPVDFLSRLGAVTIPAGQQGATIDLAVVSDDRAEPVETFGVLLGNPVNGVVGRGAAVVTVNDDDSGTSNDDTVPTLRLTALRRSGRAISVRLSCPRQETRCSVRLSLFSSADRRSRARTLRTERRIGRRSLTLRGGQSRTVRLSLPRTILAAARRAGRLKLSAFTVTRDAADNVHSGRRSATLRFRRR